jgi:hypothetical protein
VFIIIERIQYTYFQKKVQEVILKYIIHEEFMLKHFLNLLFKIDIYNYDLFFKRKNDGYVVRGNIVDYYDFVLSIIIKGIKFRNLFLRDQFESSVI